MIDLHSHLLPGVDDGSRSLEQSLGVLWEMARHGITDVCLTPHLPASEAAGGPPAAHDAAFAALADVAPERPRLHRGAEIMMDTAFPAAAAEARQVTLGGSRCLLIEFPRMVSFAAVARAVTGVRELGLRPLVAHPERYACCSVEAAQRWKALGAALQVDATTVLGERRRAARARELVSAGLADILAADNHGDGKIVAAVHDVMTQRGGAVQADLLCRGNPERLLHDEDLIPVPPFEMSGGWWERMKGRLGR